ncbi:MAG: acetyl-CoA carboxylase biotin carboxyl carrier protein subunit, partial [Chloroflexi bacterium]|nr:acetyl-CoA carboxylase biotin carboxyl carrier protein subunit [Chloroflexota bacterium]
STGGSMAQAPAPSAQPELDADDAVIAAPIPGIVLRYVVEVGQHVSAGDAVVLLEAMKMENSLPSPIDGTVKALPATQGETVAKDAVLAIISP